MVVGDLVGEGAAREEAVVGETPNLAARLQAAGRAGRGGDRATARAGCSATCSSCATLGPTGLKGFAEPVRGFAVLGERRAESRFEARRTGRLAPLVGREQELALLLERWRQAKAGEGQVVLLVGEAGIGKSRLVRAMLEAVAGEPHIAAPLPMLALPRRHGAAPAGDPAARPRGRLRRPTTIRSAGSTSSRRCCADRRADGDAGGAALLAALLGPGRGRPLPGAGR